VIAELEYDGSDSVRTGDAVRGEGHKEPGCLDHEQTDKLHFLPFTVPTIVPPSSLVYLSCPSPFGRDRFSNISL